MAYISGSLREGKSFNNLEIKERAIEKKHVS